ncbi:hypothetical protein GGQ64_004142 [Rhizobium azooxidifex]|uniref:Uncharacterized protein n=1 Tax=Mycoplana azooxidifex TaxID=1636188 RepID=A0A7W6D8Z6_9HYPH|nr:hypothetical protein [Mycoplana azooxidifex]MBB3978906.1 hypothetical protein [Mycoplana azooxidifex]
MACPELARDEYTIRQPLPAPFDWWVRTIVEALLPSLSTRVPRLDIDDLPDHLKRDLGFLDGRDRYCDEGR